MGCRTKEGADPAPSGQPVQLTILHTSDWHSRLIPYDLQLAATDRRLIEGYAPTSPIVTDRQPLVQIGGVTRMATLIKRERARSPNVVWLDSGDCFQGAPIFNAFNGEVEVRAMSKLGADAVVIGNHEFDKGLDNLALQYERWGSYPLLAANYIWERDRKGSATMARLTRPYVILTVGGLKVGVIGMANLSSLNSIGEGTNSLGVQPLDEVQTVQFYIDFLADQVDLVGIVSHMGLTGHDARVEDYEVIDQTVGLDFVFGGHLHVVLDPPQVRFDAAGRPVVLTHSGAFMKYLGRLDVVVEDSEDPYFGWEVTSHRYHLFPLDRDVPEDPEMVAFLDPYVLELNRRFDLTGIIAYAPNLVPRFGREKAGSELGNIAAESMADRQGVQADFALTNTLGIRTDIIRGPITRDQMFNVFPFDNFITKMFMSGREVCEMMTFVARRSAGRGCQPQAQFSDRAHVKLNCVVDRPECSFASGVAIRNQARYDACLEGGGVQRECDLDAREPIDPLHTYEVAVNDYIARGGSGFRVLKFNNARFPTDISIRDAVAGRFRSFSSCFDGCVAQCMEDEACLEALEGPLESSGCEALSNCVGDVTVYHDRFCDELDERDPRDFCDAVDLARAENDPDTETLATFQTYCRGVRAQALALEAGEVLPDDCYVATVVRQNALAKNIRVATAATNLREAFRRMAILQPSDACQCKLDAQLTADAECRQLACVVGRADDRLETELYETYVSAEAAYADQLDTDLCAAQAIRTGCDAEDLVGIGTDEEPN